MSKQESDLRALCILVITTLTAVKADNPALQTMSTRALHRWAEEVAAR